MLSDPRDLFAGNVVHGALRACVVCEAETGLRRAAADMIWPDWQYPHCTTSRSSHARCSALPCEVVQIASMVVTAPSPTLSIGVMHDRRGVPSTCTAHTPHSAIPQPNLVPVIPSTSRNTHSNGVSASTSTLCAVPLTLRVKAIVAC